MSTTDTATHRPTGTLLSATGLTKAYGSQAAVDQVDLTLGRGGVVGLLGPNGAGKTTLLRMLATVLAPDPGTLSAAGPRPGPYPRQRAEIRRRLGYLPQSPRLYGGVHAARDGRLRRHPQGAHRREPAAARGTRVLEAVGLGRRDAPAIRTLSGGMQQRVALAAALLGDPDLLVLDEPATGLDPEQRLELRSSSPRPRTAACVVLSTHNTTEVAALCQQVLVMDRGRICWSGTPAELAGEAEGRVWESDVEEPTALRAG